ncbi:MAG: hypothetical protein BGO03_07745 [Mesorhizobium sp. 61-13]|nr:MAG: hypothetical protein BGO03_07745 [Mesorhizobium sp. 61-13]
MPEIAISALSIALLGGMSLWANRHFAKFERLPMQWSLTGKVNWSASRRLALMLTPVLATLTLLFVGLTFVASEALGSRESLTAAAAISGGFLGAHALHLYMISRTLSR